MSALAERISAALSAELRSVAKYAASSSWPAIVDKDDEEAWALIQETAAAESTFLDRLSALLAESGGDALIDGTYLIEAPRLNFARASHLIGVIAPTVQEEAEKLRALTEGEGKGSPFTRLIQGLVAVKADFADRMAKMAASVQEERAQSQAGGAAKSDAKPGKAKAAADGALPFRDADMPISERMAKVQSASLELKLWAAMAQTDCTACGYDCEGYAKAIAAGQEKDLGKCVPGEDETANMLKKLVGA